MILLAIEDITERKEIEKGLEKTRKELEVTKISEDAAREYAESIINTVREPLISLDQDLRVVTASRSFYDVFKVTPEETVGQLIYDLGNKQWNIPKLRELLETILPQKASFDNYEVEHEFSTIGRRIMLLNARQIQRVSGKERIILLAIEDITERRQLESLLEESEERFRRLFETANDGIVLLEKHEGKITHANPASTEMLGYSKEECIGKKLQNIGVSLDMGDFQKIMQTLDKSGIIYYDDVPVKTKAGQYIDTDIYMVDRARLVQCNMRDITERKRVAEVIKKNEEQLRNLTAYMQKVTEMERTNIAREIHDELGQALTILKMDLSLFRKMFSEDQTSILEKTDAMSRLIDKTIQTVKRIATDLRPGLLDDLGLSAAIEWQLGEFQERTGITCKIIIDPKDVTFDRDRNTALFRIFQETLTNIARHAEATEVSVSLKQKDGQIELKVQDNGRGITEEELTHPKSFGLIGIRERAIIFGGDSNVKGFPGKGTTVTVKIPAKNIQES
ncbi:MAG: PAS domain S-box protein [Thermodesulfovibrionales bacterium]